MQNINWYQLVVQRNPARRPFAFCAPGASLVCLVDESSTMLIACSTCSEPGGISRSPGEQIREPQRKRIRFGLVRRNTVVANLQKMVKPATDGKATSLCSHRAIRGDWGQRAETDTPGTWESHSGGSNPNVAVEHIRLDRPVWKSETSIVVSENERGSVRRGVTVDQRPTSQGVPLG